jgi:DNA-binding MarR family transcriptional regulator
MNRFDGTEGRGSLRGATGEHRRGHLTLVRPAAKPTPAAPRGHREHQADDGVKSSPGSAQRMNRFDWERSIRRLRLGMSTKAVALMLASYANGDDGGNAHPGVDRLAAELEIHERTVRRHLTRLAKLGLIEKTSSGSSAGRRRRADCWALTLPDDAATRIGLTPNPALQ